MLVREGKASEAVGTVMVPVQRGGVLFVVGGRDAELYVNSRPLARAGRGHLAAAPLLSSQALRTRFAVGGPWCHTENSGVKPALWAAGVRGGEEGTERPAEIVGGEESVAAGELLALVGGTRGGDVPGLQVLLELGFADLVALIGVHEAEDPDRGFLAEPNGFRAGFNVLWRLLIRRSTRDSVPRLHGVAAAPGGRDSGQARGRPQGLRP
ncbi:hypothetical protein ACFV7Q_21225 [Streptomyces sp. NPDC059851]|uniref:hypothetical protein n=1 Tax=Streptomyces sp. NPDC059851 TaxID=3346971 RepID=UPI00365B7960